MPRSLLDGEPEQPVIPTIPDLPGIGELTAYLTRLQTKRKEMEQALAKVQDVQRDFAGWEPCEEIQCQEAVKTVEVFKLATHPCTDMIIKERETEGYPAVMGWLHIRIMNPFFQIDELADEVSMHLVEYSTICTSQKVKDLRIRKQVQHLLHKLVTTGETAIKSLVALNSEAYTEHQQFYQETRTKRQE